MASNSSVTSHPRKISSSIIVLAACLFGIAIGLFGLNLYHANKCSGSQSSEELENYITALNNRLLQAESQVNFFINFSNN